MSVSQSARRMIAALMMPYLAACAAEAAEKAPALTVVVAPVSAQTLQARIIATGTVAPWRDIPVGTEASGLAITAVAVDEGDIVEKGQVLARLSDSILRAQIAQQSSVISELEATLATAQSDERRAQSVGTGVITAQTAEQRSTLVKTMSAKLAAARASLGEINARLKQTEIIAPTAGMISSRSAELGQVVQAGTEMFRLIQDRRLEVNALVPEADLLTMRDGLTVRVFGPTGSAETGRVRIVAPIVDAKTRLGTVRVSLDPNTMLKSGMFARVEIIANEKTALAVPLKSLVWHDAKAGVFKVTDAGIAHLTEISIGRKTSETVEVVNGLSAGDHIVVDGAGLLHDGDTVRVDVASALQKVAP
jgi:HlyD family secretion protein